MVCRPGPELRYIHPPCTLPRYIRALHRARSAYRPRIAHWYIGRRSRRACSTRSSVDTTLHRRSFGRGASWWCICRRRTRLTNKATRQSRPTRRSDTPDRRHNCSHRRASRSWGSIRCPGIAAEPCGYRTPQPTCSMPGRTRARRCDDAAVPSLKNVAAARRSGNAPRCAQGGADRHPMPQLCSAECLVETVFSLRSCIETPAARTGPHASVRLSHPWAIGRA